MDVSDFFFFFCSGRGKGESEAPGGVGDRFFIENPRRGGRPGGAEGPEGCLRRIGEFWGGGGLNIFFQGRNVHQVCCACNIGHEPHLPRPMRLFEDTCPVGLLAACRVTLRFVAAILLTILTQMMADEFNFLWSETQNYIAEADADLIPVPGQLQ